MRQLNMLQHWPTPGSAWHQVEVGEDQADGSVTCLSSHLQDHAEMYFGDSELGWDMVGRVFTLHMANPDWFNLQHLIGYPELRNDS